MNWCKLFGHKTPFYFIKCKLGNSFYYEKSYCRRCHENIGKYEGLHQRMWSAMGGNNDWIWCMIDNKPVDIHTNCNNPRWYLTLVYSSNDFEGMSYTAKVDGIIEGSNMAHYLKGKFNRYISNDENWKVGLPYNNLNFNFMRFDLERVSNKLNGYRPSINNPFMDMVNQIKRLEGYD